MATSSASLAATSAIGAYAVLRPLREPSRGLTSRRASYVVSCTMGTSRSRARSVDSSFSFSHWCIASIVILVSGVLILFVSASRSKLRALGPDRQDDPRVSLSEAWPERREFARQIATYIQLEGKPSLSPTIGGSNSATNCLLLHPECHDRVHRLRLSVSKLRLLSRGVCGA